MKRFCCGATALTGAFLAALILGEGARIAEAQDKQDPKKGKPRFTVGKDTTYFSGPLTKDGHIDYVAAVNERLREGVTPDTNAVVLLWKAFGPRPDGNMVPPEFFRWLGIDPPPDKGDYFVSLYPFIKEHIRLFPEKQLNTIYDDLDRASYRPWTAKQHQLIAD